MEPAKLNSFFFVGKDPPENPHIGDIWCRGGIGTPLMLWTGTEAVEIKEDLNIACDFPPMTDKLEYPTHCSSCGAPVNSSRRKCEYCGVKYRKISYKN